MHIISCPRGHFFNADRYQRCPICQAPVLSVVLPGEDPSETDEDQALSILTTPTMESTLTDPSVSGPENANAAPSDEGIRPQ